MLDPARLREIEARIARDLEEWGGEEGCMDSAPDAKSADSSSPQLQITSHSPSASRSTSAEGGASPLGL